MKKIIILVLAITMSGCATYARRVNHPEFGHLYPATRLNVNTLRHPNNKGAIGEDWWLFRLIMILDTPISLTTDTALLPIDILVKIFRPETKK